MHLFVYLSPFRDDDAFIYREGSRSYLNQAAVDRLETLHADKVPDALNGPVKYRVKYVEREPLSTVADGDGDVPSMFPEMISVRKGEGHFNIAMGPMNAKMTPALTRRSSVNPTK